MASIEQCQFPPNEALALVFLPACKATVDKQAFIMTNTLCLKKHTAMHPHAFCCHPVSYFVFLRRSFTDDEASLLRDIEESFSSYFYCQLQ